MERQKHDVSHALYLLKAREPGKTHPVALLPYHVPTYCDGGREMMKKEKITANCGAVCILLIQRTQRFQC